MQDYTPMPSLEHGFRLGDRNQRAIYNNENKVIRLTFFMQGIEMELDKF